MCALFVYEPNLFQDARIPFGLLVKSNVTSEKEKNNVGCSSADFHNSPQQMGQPSHGRALHLGKDPVRLRSKGRTNWWGAGNIYHLMGYLTKFGILWGAVITRSCHNRRAIMVYPPKLYCLSTMVEDHGISHQQLPQLTPEVQHSNYVR